MESEENVAEVAWEGDSLEVLRGFSHEVRSCLGADLRRLQIGEQPLDSRPMKSIGKRVFELRQQDRRGWYRLIYLAKVESTIYVLHCFEKRTRKTPPRELQTAKARLTNVMARLKRKK